MTMLTQQMRGALTDANGNILMAGGFMTPNIPVGGFNLAPGAATPEVQRGLSPETQENIALLQRGEFTGDLSQVVAQLASDIGALQRGITTQNVGFPVRENLEAYAATLVPTETPVRNMLPRIAGFGAAAAWRQIISLGGGWGTGYGQPGGGSIIRPFYPETGAPVERTTVYAPKLAPYKLLGTLGSVSGFAMATGATYQDQLAREKQNQMLNLMLNEEWSLIYGDSTVALSPWGDGVNPLAFDGLWTQISTANGTPAAQVQTAVGPLTTAHIDAQLTRIHNQGARGLFILMNAQEALSLVTLLQKTGSINRFSVNDAGNATVGFRVANYIHPISGQQVAIYTSLFLLPGDIIFGATTLPDGSPAAQVSVLPQVYVDTAPEKPTTTSGLGYTMTDLARGYTQPDMHGFQISVYETLMLRSALHFAKSSGVTPAV